MSWIPIRPGVVPDPKWPAGFEPSPAQNSSLYRTDALLAERAKSYDDPTRNFQRIADMWSALFGWDVNANDVGLAMICVKLSREWFAHKQDNLDDIAGYAECISIIERSNNA